jgi:hypothetical protein
MTQSMLIPDPVAYPLKWDKVQIGSAISPGLATVNEFKRRWVWDEKIVKGGQGANLTYTGKKLTRGTIDFLLFAGPISIRAVDTLLGTGQFSSSQAQAILAQQLSSPSGVTYYTDLSDWQTFSQLFQYDPTKSAATAIQIYHPSLAMIGLKAVICEDVGNPTRIAIGLYKVVVSLIEYAPPPPKSAVSTPSAAVAKAPGANAPPGTQQDPSELAVQKQIAAESAKAQAPLPGGP